MGSTSLPAALTTPLECIPPPMVRSPGFRLLGIQFTHHYSSIAGICVREIAEHSHYVQGVAWDPLNEFVASQSSDR